MKSFDRRSQTDIYATQADGVTLEISSLKFSDNDDPIKGCMTFTDDSKLDLKRVTPGFLCVILRACPESLERVRRRI